MPDSIRIPSDRRGTC